METQENLQQQETVATPPPFRSTTATQEQGQEQTASPTLADRIAALGLDEDISSRLTRLTQGIGDDNATDDLLSTLARGITHDADVQNADAEGYLRGRNEKIETVLPPSPAPQDETESTPVFPRYCRRSIWD